LLKWRQAAEVLEAELNCLIRKELSWHGFELELGE
jgi:hypothetical protein